MRVRPPTMSILLILAATVLLVVHAGHVRAEVLQDNFNDNAISSALWVATRSPSTASVDEVNQRVEISLGAGIANAGLVSRCSAVGDFDAQVDYGLLVWPSNNRHGLRLSPVDLGGGPFGQIGIYRNDSPQGFEFYTVVFGESAQQVVTTDLSGKMRLVRAGSTLTGYFGSNNAWIPIGSGAVGSGPTRFSIDNSSSFATALGVMTIFDNFALSAGTLVCPTAEVVGLKGAVDGFLEKLPDLGWTGTALQLSVAALAHAGIPIPIGPVVVSLGLLEASAQVLMVAYTDIRLAALAFDPVEPEFAVVFVPQSYTLPGIPPPVLGPMLSLYSHLEALQVTVDRHNQALIAGDPGSVRIQQEAIYQYLADVIASSAQASLELRNLLMLAEANNVPDIPITRAEALAFQERLLTVGFPSEEVAAMTALGLTSGGIARLKASLLDVELPADAVIGTALGALSAAADAIRDLGQTIGFGATVGALVQLREETQASGISSPLARVLEGMLVEAANQVRRAEGKIAIKALARLLVARKLMTAYSVAVSRLARQGRLSEDDRTHLAALAAAVVSQIEALEALKRL